MQSLFKTHSGCEREHEGSIRERKKKESENPNKQMEVMGKQKDPGKREEVREWGEAGKERDQQ